MALAPLLNSANKQLYVLRETTGDKRVINPRVISNTTGAPNPGPGLEYLPVYREQIIPDYDPRFFTMNTVDTVAEAGDQVNVTYVTTERPVEEVKTAIDNAKRLQVQKRMPAADQTEAMLIFLAAIARQSKGLELTPQEVASMETLLAVAADVTRDKTTADQLKAQVELGHKPDIDAAWAPLAAK